MIGIPTKEELPNEVTSINAPVEGLSNFKIREIIREIIIPSDILRSVIAEIIRSFGVISNFVM